jgi:hypothetical protein
MKIYSALLFVFSVTQFSFVHAETVATVDQFFESMHKFSVSKCSNQGEEMAKRYEAQGQKIEAYAMRSGERIICECLPAGLKKMQASIPRPQRGAKIAEGEFGKKYFLPVVNQCAAASLRETYIGGCAERYATYKPRSANYCACMSRTLNDFSDSELAEAGTANADYAPAAVEAKKRGLPLPEKPMLLQRLEKVDSACTAE